MKHWGKRLLALLLLLLLSLALNLGMLSTTALAAEGENLLTNGGFETDIWDGDGFWTVDVQSWTDTTVKCANEETAHEGSHYLNYWSQSAQTITVSQEVNLEAGTYELTAWVQGDDSTFQLFAGDDQADAVSLSGYGTWDSGTYQFTVDSASEYTVGVNLICENGGWGYLDDMSLTLVSDDAAEEGYKLTVTPSTTDEVQAGDTVTLSIGVTYNGETITDLSGAGLNLTTWLDYWDSNGHGDGNSDAAISAPNALETDVTLPSEGTYYLVTELYGADWAVLDSVLTKFTVSAAAAEMKDIPLENGGFDDEDLKNWELNGFTEIKQDSYAANNTTNMLNLWLSDDEEKPGSASYTVTLIAGTYQFGFDLSGADADSGLSYAVKAGGEALVSGAGSYTTSGWDVWDSYVTETFTLTEETAVTFTLSGIVPAGYWGYLDNLVLKGTGAVAEEETPDEEDTAVAAEINVDKVSNLSADFIMGMDISSVVSEFNSGVVYYDFEGNEINNVTDFCKFLAKCGVTSVRVRVWNDPFDDNGYGGGNNDINTAVEIANGCAAAGLSLLVDFHCSDFWTDPGKQQAPKEWEYYTLDQKAAALKAYLTNSLTRIKTTGVEIAMVQVGNETTSGFIGETSVANMCTLFSAGAAAIRDFEKSIKVVIHVTNPEKSTMTTWAQYLAQNNVDYDVLATSYYPSWHGTFANLKSQLEAVRNTYGKDVMVAETSYAYTLADTDGHDNTIREGTNDTMMCETQYPFTPPGTGQLSAGSHRLRQLGGRSRRVLLGTGLDHGGRYHRSDRGGT